MEYTFSENDIENELNIVELEDMIFYATSIKGCGKNYVLMGKAVIDEETFHFLQLEFELTDEPMDDDVDEIMTAPWEWYDYIL